MYILCVTIASLLTQSSANQDETFKLEHSNEDKIWKQKVEKIKPTKLNEIRTKNSQVTIETKLFPNDV